MKFFRSKKFLMLLSLLFLASQALSSEAGGIFKKEWMNSESVHKVKHPDILYKVRLHCLGKASERLVYAFFDEDQEEYTVVCDSDDERYLDASDRCRVLKKDPKISLPIKKAKLSRGYQRYFQASQYSDENIFTALLSYFYSYYPVHLGQLLSASLSEKEKDQDLSGIPAAGVRAGITTGDRFLLKPDVSGKKLPQSMQYQYNSYDFNFDNLNANRKIQSWKSSDNFVPYGAGALGLAGSVSYSFSQNSFKDIIKDIIDDTKGGFGNLGNTCFANATTVLLLESPYLETLTGQELKASASWAVNDESPEQLKSRQKFQQSLATLAHARNARDATGRYVATDKYMPRVKKYFQAFNETSLLVDETEEVGGPGGGYLMQDQCDAGDFLRKIHEYLQHPESGLEQKLVLHLDDLGRSLGDAAARFNTKIHHGVISLHLRNTEIPTRLSDLLVDLMAPELLEDGNEVMGESGRKYPATQTYGFRKLPQAAVIWLRRFTLDDQMDQKLKISSPITVDQTIKLHTFNKGEESAYRLKAVVIHHGSVIGGHYFAYVYRPELKSEHKWVLYDDSYTSRVSAKVVADDALRDGYILLYTKSGEK